MSLTRKALLAAALAVAATLPAAAAERSWTFNADEEGAYLNFGMPESDDTLIAMSCEPKRGTWELIAYIDAKGVKPGKPAKLTLSAGGRSATLAGKGQSDEMNGITDVLVEGKIDQAALAVLAEKGPLVVTVPGSREEIDPTTMEDKGAKFAAACGKK
jgi:hypothetical protein